MIIKEKFSLLKDLPNILDLSKSVIDTYKIEGGPRKIFVILKLMENRIKHFTKDPIMDILSNIKKRERIVLSNIPNYLLPISYDRSMNSIIINLTAMGSDDISRHDPKNIYASLVYGITFSILVTKKYNIDMKYFSTISNFLVSIFIRLFGKDYGLLGIYSTEIPKLKFLTNCYVLDSFFGIKGNNAYRLSGSASSFDYKKIENELNDYDFYEIKNFIKALSDFKVMPGINRYVFSSKVLRLFGYGFLPALEDISRFISIITTSSLSGSNVVPTFISKYNETEYNKLLEISKNIYKKL
jgi:hypothetical protein